MSSACHAPISVVSIRPMKLKDAVAHFGSEYKIAQVLDIHQSCITRWRKDVVPMKRAYQLHIKSGKKLAFDPAFYNKP